ncbi:MAG TPA: glutamine amidotransferase [Thermoanaerobaculia bacterium]|nr:glutamine amidotransferase [Thermoanaerobaculia bacterium]
MPWFDSLFELLFKYPPRTFASGSLRFAPSWVFLAVAAVLLIAVLPGLWRYWGQRAGRARLLVAARALLLLVIVFCLARPMLILRAVVPQESFVGVLIDDSRSMTIADAPDVARGAAALRLLDPEGGDLLGALGQRFKVRLFSFADDLQRVSSPAELRFQGTASHLGEAIERGADELAAVPLAGLVVLTDGADNSGEPLDDSILELKSRGVPIYPIGVGRERFDRDVQVSRVEAPRRVLRGSSLMVEVTLEQTGYAGEVVDLEVMDDGRIVSSEKVRFPATGEAVVARVSFKADQAGARQFQFRTAPQRGEAVAENNKRGALIQVDDRVEKVLYFEGEPRYEVKYMRRAVHGDKNLQLVVLLRTADNRFSRFELDEPGELEGGFPTKREELFRYDGLILGSIEASFFTHDQLRLIAEFVAERGGGFMMIGGRRAFSEGGWSGTPLAEVLPVILSPAWSGGSGEGDPFFAEVSVEPTTWGKSHPALQLASTEDASLQVWERLPKLSTFNPLTQIKPGATSLLVGKGEGLPGEQVVLAYQRYGRGKAMAWSVHDSWHWQMHADIPVEDQTHETLWRQLLRWLVSYVPEPVEVTVGTDIVAPGQRVEVRAEVHDQGFLPVNNANVTATVETPGGQTIAVPLDWTVEKDGEYVGGFAADEEGLYGVRVEAGTRSQSLGESSAWVESAALENELYDAQLRRSSLERLASETGGRYYDADNARGVVDDLAFSREGSTLLERRDLWDMPIVFVVLAALLALEWGLRRRWGMA